MGGVIRALERVYLARVAMGEPAPADSALPLPRKGLPLFILQSPVYRQGRGHEASQPGLGEGKVVLLFWRAIWHSVSKPLNMFVPLDPADLHLENYPKETP